MKQRIRRIESLSEFIKMTAYDARAKIPETVIDNFVDRVVFDHGDFIWYLNPTFGNEVYSQTTSDWKKQLSTASSDTKDTSYACSSTDSYYRITDGGCWLLTEYEEQYCLMSNEMEVIDI